MAAVAPSRLAALTKLRCGIFQTTYNPQALRTGAKYLKQKLRGPAIVNYYPTKLNISLLSRKFKELDLIDEAEVERFEDVSIRQKRGKGAPKKARTKGTSRMSSLPWVYGHLLFVTVIRGEPKVEEETLNSPPRHPPPAGVSISTLKAIRSRQPVLHNQHLLVRHGCRLRLIHVDISYPPSVIYCTHIIQASTFKNLRTDPNPDSNPSKQINCPGDWHLKLNIYIRLMVRLHLKNGAIILRPRPLLEMTA